MVLSRRLLDTIRCLPRPMPPIINPSPLPSMSGLMSALAAVASCSRRVLPRPRSTCGASRRALMPPVVSPRCLPATSHCPSRSMPLLTNFPPTLSGWVSMIDDVSRGVAPSSPCHKSLPVAPDASAHQPAPYPEQMGEHDPLRSQPVASPKVDTIPLPPHASPLSSPAVCGKRRMPRERQTANPSPHTRSPRGGRDRWHTMSRPVVTSPPLFACLSPLAA